MPGDIKRQRAHLIKTDPNSGMALVKSNDGRTKWLTVSADPSLPSWDERVRTWASKLGVCAQPPPTPQGTPLPTPPPDNSAEQQRHWPAGDESKDKANNSSWGESANIPPTAPPMMAEMAVPKKKQSAKRAGSFARGFLLGLGGGGGTAARSRSPTVAEDTSVIARASTLAEGDRVASCEGAIEEQEDGHTRAQESPATVAVSGRERWVKGFPISPSSSSDSSTSISSSSGSSNGIDDLPIEETDASANASDKGKGKGKGDNCGNGHEDVLRNCNGMTAPPKTYDADLGDLGHAEAGPGGDEDMAWLETGPAAHSINGTTPGAGGKTGAKKKKKNKSKSKSSKSKRPSTSKTNPAQADLGEATNSRSAPQGEMKGEMKSETKGKNDKPRRRCSNVTFDRVNLLEFTRDVGGCAVPSDGTWGLALGIPFRETTVDVDGYEASKAEILENRMSELTKKERHLATGETRQFDYRPIGERNPLFTRLGEKDRSKRLLEYACFHKGDLEAADREDAPLDGSSKENDQDHVMATSEFSHKVSHAEFVDKSQEAKIELTALRDSRKTSQGCNCVCVRADKLNVAKLRGELSKRGVKKSGSKKELAKTLHEVMRLEEEQDGTEAHKVCRSEECQCVKDGVGCHADLCNCCKGPKNGKNDLHHGGNCGNTEGVYAYSSSAVRSYRGQYVTAKPVSGREKGHARSDSICSEHH